MEFHANKYKEYTKTTPPLKQDYKYRYYVGSTECFINLNHYYYFTIELFRFLFSLCLLLLYIYIYIYIVIFICWSPSSHRGT